MIVVIGCGNTNRSDDGAGVRVVQELLAEFERSKDDALVYLEALLMATRDPEYRARALALTSSIDEGDIGSLSRQRETDRPPQPARATGHQRHSPRQHPHQRRTFSLAQNSVQMSLK